MKERNSVLCYGEIVWDALPEGIFLGGAPLNVAYHLNQLGIQGIPVSAVGDDFLGAEVRRRLGMKKISIDLISTDKNHPTGVVIVQLNEAGDAQYEIREPAAWDFIHWREALYEAVREASGFVYGSLITRNADSENTLSECLKYSKGIKFCDVNLRPPYDDRERVLMHARKADWIKLNEDETYQLISAAKEDAPLKEALAALAEDTGVPRICCTRGGDGAALWVDGQYSEMPSPEVQVEDTVGAGDAFTAAFLAGLLEDRPPETCLRKAVELGAFVASRHGAQPEYG